MILLEEDIQQLRKIKGTGEQIFNFSTLRAAFKGVSRQKVKSKPVLNAACCLYITLQNYENKSSCIVINKLFISYKHREIHSLKEGGASWLRRGRREGGGGGGKTSLVGWRLKLLSPCTPCSPGLKKLGCRDRIRWHEGTKVLPPSPVVFFLFLYRFMLSRFHHFVYSI